MEVISHRLKVL